MMITLFAKITFVFAFQAFIKLCESSCSGCVELDELTFDKVITKFEYSLVKFDIAFPYGEKHEAFSEFAKQVGPNIDNLLVSLVGIKDYGEKDNSLLGQRYGVEEKKYPVIILFQKSNPINWIKYPENEPITLDNIKTFVKKNTNLYIGLQGCLQQFDEFAKNFGVKALTEQEVILKGATVAMEQMANTKEKNNASIYIKIMKKIMEKGINFVTHEERRLEKLLENKISDTKKNEFNEKRNILQSFHADTSNNEKNEL